MNLTELIIAESRERGLQHFFGIPGGGSPLDVMDAGRRYGVDFISVAHESSAAIMAAYYGAMKGTAGLALAVKGVGAGNLVGGVTNAYFERLPLLCICESPSTDAVNIELVQHCDHQKLFGAVIKHYDTLGENDQITTIKQAVSLAVEGRPGPVLLDLPSDLGQMDCGESIYLQNSAITSSSVHFDIRTAKDMIATAKRPVILAGADVIRENATNHLKTLVENIQAAVLVTMDARGVFSEDQDRWAGVFKGTFGPNIIETEILKEADLVLLIGVDAMMSHLPWKINVPTVEFVARSEYSTLSKPNVRVNGNLKSVIESANGHTTNGFSVKKIQEIRQKISHNFKRPTQTRFAIQDIIETTREILPIDGALISETGAFIAALEHFWRVKEPQTYCGTSGGRSMGLTIPATLGAKLAKPDLPIIGLGGDGSLLMRLGELEVFARTGIAVPLVIVNDQSLGTMKWRQKNRDMTDYGLDFYPVDLAMLAKSCGLNGVTVNTPEEFRRELRLAMNSDKSTLIDARVDPVEYQKGFGKASGV